MRYGVLGQQTGGPACERVTGHMADSQKPGGTGHFPEHRGRPLLPPPRVWTQGRAQRVWRPRGQGVSLAHVSGQPLVGARHPGERAGWFPSDSSASRAGNSAGQCRAPRGTDQLLHFLRGGSVSCYTRQGWGLPNPWDEAGLSIPEGPPLKPSRVSSACPGSPSDRGRRTSGPDTPGPPDTRLLHLRVASDPGARLSQAGALAAPKHRKAAWCQDACPWPGTPVASSVQQRVGAKRKCSGTKKSQKGLQTVYPTWKSTGRAPKHPC